MRLFAIFRGVLRDALDADGKKIVNLATPTQDADAANKAYVDASTGAVLDDTVTQSSANGVKSSGIWSWVKSLLPSWLTPGYAEPATVESVNAKYTKPTGGIPASDIADGVIPALAAPSVSATDAQAAKAKATYDFVNSSVNAMAAFFLAKDSGESFATRAELAACTSFLRNGLTGQKPTQNDYTIVVNDETNPIYQAGVFAVYSKWTATDDYVGYWVDYNGAKTLVTSANKNSLGIIVGGNSPTVPYTRIVPTSRYSYQGEWETAGANGWRFQYSINTSGFTAAQLAALNSGASAELFAQIAQSLAQKANTSDVPAIAVGAMNAQGISSDAIGIGGPISGLSVSDQYGDLRTAIAGKANQSDIFGNDGKPTDTFATDLLGKPVAKEAMAYSQIPASGTSEGRSVKVYTATDTLPSPIPLPSIPSTGIVDLEVWIEAGSTAPSNVTFSPGIIPKDGKALEFAANSTNIIHLTARGGATHYTAVAAAFAAESSTQA